MSDLVFAIALTTHIGLSGSYNEIHPAVKYENDNGMIAGAYYNSERNISVYAGYKFNHENLWFETGLVTGYAYPVVPMVRAGYDMSDTTSVFILPAVETNGKKTNVGFAFGVEFRTKQ